MQLSRTLVAAVILAACVPPAVATSPPPTTTAPTTSTATDVIARINAERSRNGLTALTMNAKLMEAARIQAVQMAKYQRLDHTISGAPYPDMKSRFVAVGYAYSAVAENVAWNQPDARAAVAAWMTSSGHRANILDPRFTETGVAMTRDARGEPYWVQVFGTPR
jgi:uncharacterized protein YkwD